jgi:hypothetical protein
MKIVTLNDRGTGTNQGDGPILQLQALLLAC